MLFSLALYAVFLIVLFVVRLVTRNKDSVKAAHYKMSLTVMRQILRLFNLILSIIVMVSASTSGFLDTSFKAFMIILSGFTIFLNLAIVWFRLRWAKKKKAKGTEKPRYEDAKYALKDKR
jgi:L-asparagine transporter-like permease